MLNGHEQHKPQLIEGPYTDVRSCEAKAAKRKLGLSSAGKLIIVVDGRMPGLNDYDAQNSNWRKNGKAKKLWSGLVAEAAKVVARNAKYDLVDIHYHWIEPNKKRDKDNVRFAAKFVNDGLVKAGVIPADGWKNVNNLSDSFSVDSERPRVEITVTPVVSTGSRSV